MLFSWCQEISVGSSQSPYNPIENMATTMRVLLLAFFSWAALAVQFTPEAMLSVLRRGSALPNPAGTLALYTVSKYSFEKHKSAISLNVIELTTGKSTLFSNSSAVGEAVWI